MADKNAGAWIRTNWKAIAGIAVSAAFLYLALHEVDPAVSGRRVEGS